MEAVDSSVDYTLITKCKSMIKVCLPNGFKISHCYVIVIVIIKNYSKYLQKHCKEELSDIFGCLKQHRNDDGFDEQCHFVVINRMRLRSEG